MATDEVKPGILRRLKINRVDLVDMGANFDAKTGDGAHIMLHKRADQPVVKDSPSLASVHVDSAGGDERDDYEKATLDSDSRNKLPDSAFAAVWTDAQGKKQRKLPIHDANHLAAARGRLDAADLPANVKADARRKIEAATNKEKTVEKGKFSKFVTEVVGLFTETDVEKRNKAAAELIAKADDMDKAVEHTDSADCKCAKCMEKAADPDKDKMPPAFAKRLEAIEANATVVEKANADLRKQLAVEVEKRLDGEMETVLKSFKATPFDLKTDVAHFRKMKQDTPEVYERTMALFKAADAQMAFSKAFDNAGSSRSGGRGDAWGEIEARADAMVEKSTKDLTREQAIDKVLSDPKNNALVKRYREEQQ